MSAAPIKKLPPLDELRRVLDYNPATGIFTWLVSRGRAPAGTEAGFTDNKGYRVITVNWRHYFAHRLAWVFSTGENPTLQIDHIDMNKSNNRMSNLREATSAENKYNVSIPERNTSGIKGVSWDKKSQKWKAQIQVRRIYHHLGFFRSIEDAAEVVKAARSRLHGDFANHGQ